MSSESEVAGDPTHIHVAQKVTSTNFRHSLGWIKLDLADLKPAAPQIEQRKPRWPFIQIKQGEVLWHVG